ncbi:MAG: GNAT family N-acetyltransferase [Anaerolineae bacterium]
MIQTKVAGLRIRPAQTSDRSKVLAFTEHTWGDEHPDYIEKVWDRWLADPAGRLLVAELAEEPVGMGKVSVLGPGEMWLEGLRVSPAQRGKGIAWEIFHAALKAAREMEARTVRFATGSHNEASVYMAEQLGFSRVSAFVRYEAEADAHGPGPSKLEPSREEYLAAALAGSPFLAASGHLYSRGWVLYEMTAARAKKHLGKGQVWVQGRPPDALAVLSGPPDLSPWISLLDGEREAVQALAAGLRALAPGTEGGRVQGFFPTGWTGLDFLESAGYERPSDHEIWVFETRLEAE